MQVSLVIRSMYHVANISSRVLKLLPVCTWCLDRNLPRTPSLAVQHDPGYEGLLPVMDGRYECLMNLMMWYDVLTGGKCGDCS